MHEERVLPNTVAGWFPDEPATVLDPLRVMAVDYILSRCRVPEGPLTGALLQAVHLLVGRHLARRNSPDGTLGMSEFGVGRIATVDRDVEALIAPYRKLVFG